MTRPDYQGWITDEDVERLVKAYRIVQHDCQFSEEERQIIKDIASGGKLLKKSIIYAIVALTLWALLFKGALVKIGQISGLLK